MKKKERKMKKKIEELHGTVSKMNEKIEDIETRLIVRYSIPDEIVY